MIPRFRSVLRHAWVYALYASGCLARARRRVRRLDGTFVLTLHRVLPEAERIQSFSHKGMIVERETFAALAEYLERECNVISVEDALQHRTAKEQRPRLVITFDDGWADNASHAHPILARHSLPWVIFICPEKMGQILPFWPERVIALLQMAQREGRLPDFLRAIVQTTQTPQALSETDSVTAIIESMKPLPSEKREALVEELIRLRTSAALEASGSVDSTMSWNDARRLGMDGVRFGSHTLHHEILTHIPLAQARQEIVGSCRRVADEVGHPCFSFAYPNGNFSPEVRKVVAEAGFEVAFANKPGVWTHQTDRFAVPRCNLWEGAIVGPSGRFSRAHFEYAVFWKSARSA